MAVFMIAAMATATGCKKEDDSLKNMAPDKDSAEYAAYKEANYPNDESDFIKEQWEKWNIGTGVELDWFIGSAGHTYL